MAKVIKMNLGKAKPVEKYRINELILALPVSEGKIGRIVEHLKNHNVSQHDFYRDRNIQLNSSKSIPGDRLMVYAKVFDVSLEELMNHTIKVKPLIQSRIKTPLR